MGDTISYGGEDIPRQDVPGEITPDTPKPDHEAIGEMRIVRARMEWLDEENKRLRAEVERLRWFFENMRDVDRRQLQMEYEHRNKAIERAARERQERRYMDELSTRSDKRS